MDIEEIILYTLDKFATEQKQLNFDSESMRKVLSKKIAQAITDYLAGGNIDV